MDPGMEGDGKERKQRKKGQHSTAQHPRTAPHRTASPTYRANVTKNPAHEVDDKPHSVAPHHFQVSPNRPLEVRVERQVDQPSVKNLVGWAGGDETGRGEGCIARQRESTSVEMFQIFCVIKTTQAKLKRSVQPYHYTARQ